MAELRIKTKDGQHRTLVGVADAGIAGDFVVVRYNDGIIAFTTSENISDFEFDPTGDTEEADGEGQDNTTDQQ